MNDARRLIGASPSNPMGQVPLKLPEAIAKSFPDVEDICVVCRDVIHIVAYKIWDRAKADARIAMQRATHDMRQVESDAGD